jgi:hypothetical protein
MIVSEIRLYEILKLKLGEKEAEALVQLVQSEVEAKFEQKKEQFITVADKEKLLTKADAIAIFATKEDLAKMQSHLESKINDQLKWLIVMWISQIAAIAALIKLFVK